MDLETKLELIKQVGEEILTEEELKHLLQTKEHPTAYDGFEPSGYSVHIAQGLLRSITVNKMLKAGVKFVMYAADWHAWTNLKLGGDLDKIHVAGDYLVEVWKACGMDTDKVKIIRATDLVYEKSYWKTVVKIAQSATVKRLIRCSQIMGRKESDILAGSQILYPCMQAADVYEIGADITSLGMDQKKVYVMCREIAPKLGLWKPVIVSHHMLMGLLEPPRNVQDPVEKATAMKMSKSRPDSAIFMTDSKEEIIRKIKGAYCPAKQVEENPILEYCKYILFEKFKSLKIERPDKYGGDVQIESYNELIKIYSKGDLHPMDLKNCVAARIDELINPVRNHFEKNTKARKLLEQVRSFKITQ